MLYRFPKKVFVHRAENFFGQLERAHLLAIQIVYFNRRHNLFQSVAGYQLPVTSYFFFAACRFEAFNGSTVPEPPNPRRSLGGFFAFEIKTYPSFAPGTAPSI